MFPVFVLDVYFISENNFFTEPDSPPANVSTFALRASTCVVTWQAVPLLKQNGPIVGYYLKYKDVKAPTGQSPVTVNILGASERKYNISGLAPASKYYIGVEAYNLKGIGPSNNFAATICLTLEAGMDECITVKFFYTPHIGVGKGT